MNIYGSNLVQGTQGVSAPQNAEQLSKCKDVEAKNSAPVKDEIEISVNAREISETRISSAPLNSSEVRLDRVNEARAKIAAGVYDDPKYLDAALEKMFAGF